MHLIELGLSFLEGLALIASPCILPVLPLVLGASVQGGRKRPFGIILGFVLAFSAFTLLARKFVLLLGIDVEIIQDVSLVLLGLLGLILLSEKLSNIFSALTGSVVNKGRHGSMETKDGFWSGVVIGSWIGLIWTPCAGPILAAALVQVIRQESDVSASFFIISFAFGVSVPMLVISLTGRQIISKLSFFKVHAQAVRRTLGLVMLLTVAFLASGVDPQSFFKDNDKGKVNQLHPQSMLQDALPHPYPAPELTGIEAWLNSKPLTLASLKGKVVLVDFWTYSCINCVRTLPFLTRWDRIYRDKGLVIIGIHAPEFEFEKNKANVEAAIAAHQIAYPVALDNKLDTWTAFRNLYWPAHYLIDREGKVVYTHFGEGHYRETENNVRYLLGLDKAEGDIPEISTTSEDQTPETYMGYARAARFVSLEDVKPDETNIYSAPQFIPFDHWGLTGAWHMGPEHVTAQNSGASIRFHFKAGKVFLVLGTQDGKPVEATLTLNGKPLGNMGGKDAQDGRVMVDKHTLYEVIHQSDVREGLLEITAQSPGLEAYAFTFGN